MFIILRAWHHDCELVVAVAAYHQKLHTTTAQWTRVAIKAKASSFQKLPFFSSLRLFGLGPG